jgi:hypothetical protein
VNSLIARLSAVGMMLGFVGAGIISDTLGFKVVIAIDAFSYVLSAFVLYQLKWKNADETVKLAKNIITETKEVHHYLASRPLFVLVILVSLISTFAASSHNVGIPLLAQQLNNVFMSAPSF